MNLSVATFCFALLAPTIANAQHTASPGAPSATTHPDGPASPKLPPNLSETLRWLPADVDAILVAQDFALPKAQRYVIPEEPIADPFAQYCEILATGLALSDNTLRLALEPLIGRRVEFA